MKYNDEQLRVAANLRQYYDMWIDTMRNLEALLAEKLYWKTVSEKEYLIKRTTFGSDIGCGVKTPQTIGQYETYKKQLE